MEGTQMAWFPASPANGFQGIGKPPLG